MQHSLIFRIPINLTCWSSASSNSGMRICYCLFMVWVFDHKINTEHIKCAFRRRSRGCKRCMCNKAAHATAVTQTGRRNQQGSCDRTHQHPPPACVGTQKEPKGSMKVGSGEPNANTPPERPRCFPTSPTLSRLGQSKLKNCTGRYNFRVPYLALRI
jgi:hypothetical protein